VEEIAKTLIQHSWSLKQNSIPAVSRPEAGMSTTHLRPLVHEIIHKFISHMNGFFLLYTVLAKEHSFLKEIYYANIRDFASRGERTFRNPPPHHTPI
jgi:hypothetical protein